MPRPRLLLTTCAVCVLSSCAVDRFQHRDRDHGLGYAFPPVSGDGHSTSGITSWDNKGRDHGPPEFWIPSVDNDDHVITQLIWIAIQDGEGLSVTARDLSVITIDGMVTLRGFVGTQSERLSIGSEAEQIAGPGRVINLIEVS